MRREILRLYRYAEENRAYVALLQTREVGLVIGVLLGQIVTFIDYVPRRVYVRVYYQDVFEQAGQAVVRGLRQGCGGQEEEQISHVLRL